MGEGFFVAAFAGQCIVHIGQRDQLCADGNFIALQPIRVAAPVPALVVPAGDLVGGLQQRLLVEVFQLVQHLGPQHTVGLDDLEFFRGQLAGFVEDLFVDADLADVVQGRGQRDVVLLFGGDGVLAADLQQAVEQQLGDDADVPHMGTALAVAELHDMAQHTHQHIGVVFAGADLVRHHLHQPPLLGVQLDGVGHAAVDDASIEGAGDVIAGPQLIGAPDRGVGVVAGDHDDRDVLDGVVDVHSLEHLETIHDRHVDVQQHQCDVPGLRLHFFQAFLSVFCFKNAVIAAQDLL